MMSFMLTSFDVDKGHLVPSCPLPCWTCAGLSLTGIAALCPWARHINTSLVLVQPRKTHPYITERLLMGHKESNRTKMLIRHIYALWKQCRSWSSGFLEASWSGSTWFSTLLVYICSEASSTMQVLSGARCTDARLNTLQIKIGTNQWALGEHSHCWTRLRFEFVWFDSLRPSQQSFSYVRTGLPGLNQYY